MKHHLLSKYNIKIDDKGIKALNRSVAEGEPFIQVIINILDHKINENRVNVADFNQINYDLRRTWKDSQVAAFTFIKELLKEELNV